MKYMDKQLHTILNELKRELRSVKSSMATKGDLKDLVTKNDLPKFREEITADIADVNMELINRLDKKKADKTQVTLLNARVTRIENKVSI